MTARRAARSLRARHAHARRTRLLPRRREGRSAAHAPPRSRCEAHASASRESEAQQWDEVLGFAFDHRNQFFDLAQQTGASETRIATLKNLFVEAVAQTEKELGLEGRIGVLIDDRYGQDALNAATGRGWWVGRSVELPGSLPLVFDHGRSIGTTLVQWPREQVAKCLVQYHPDHPHELRLEQEAQLRALYDAVQESGNELLLEVIVPKNGPPVEDDTVYRALKRLYNLGIYPEWRKLEPMSAKQWQAVDALIAERDPYCRSVVLLGLSAGVDQLREGFNAAASSRTCKGFTVGRTIFQSRARRGSPMRSTIAN